MDLSIGDANKCESCHWQDWFMDILPEIEKQASFAFRFMDPESKQDAICDVVAKAWYSYRRLLQRGRQDHIFPSTLARFAIAQFLDGRRFGCSNSSNDIMSDRSSSKRESCCSMNHVVDCKAVPVCLYIAATVDFQLWCDQLENRERHIVTLSLLGYTTNEIAAELMLTAARVSQLRRKIANSWLVTCSYSYSV